MKSIYQYFLKEFYEDKPQAIFVTILFVGLVVPATALGIFFLWMLLLEFISIILFGSTF
jgi:hypothetical protein